MNHEVVTAKLHIEPPMPRATVKQWGIFNRVHRRSGKRRKYPEF